MTETLVLTAKDYKSDVKPTWCPGCGDFGVLSAVYKAMAQLQLRPDQTVAVSGIGCSSRIPYFLRTYGIHGIHGRALPIAQGVKLANPDLTVLVFGGDGDFFAIGAGHLPHVCARNVDLTAIVMDNSTYGLTKGHTSPTSPVGQKTKSTPYGQIVQPLNPVLLAITYGASFVARGYSAKPQQLTDLIVQGIKHRGFSFIHVESPCTEFNNTFNYFDSAVEDLPPDWDPTDREAAMHLALTEEKVHLGIFYKVETHATYELNARHWAGEPEPFDPDKFFEKYM